MLMVLQWRPLVKFAQTFIPVRVTVDTACRGCCSSRLLSVCRAEAPLLNGLKLLD